MGLDMYLSKNYYVKNWDHMEDGEKHTITILKGGESSSIPTDKITNIQTEEMYWRKANAIHAWFVENVQEGEDDCGDYDVSLEQLQGLLRVATEVLEASKLIKGKIQNGSSCKNGQVTPIIEDGEFIEDPTVAHRLLPTQSGFFFGGTEYDEYYYRDLEYTKQELERILANPKDGGFFEYHSSW